MQSKNYPLFLTIFSVLVLNGCHKDIPKPETKIEDTISFHFGSTGKESMPVSMLPKKGNDFFVQSEVRGNDLYIQCIVPEITFRQQPTEGARKIGKIVITVDGSKKEEVRAAAFVVRNLSSGRHIIKLDVRQIGNNAFHLSREFAVAIP